METLEFLQDNTLEQILIEILPTNVDQQQLHGVTRCERFKFVDCHLR